MKHSIDNYGGKLKVIFISNYFNHHQKEVSNSLFEKTKGNYNFAETIPFPERRKSLGYRVERDIDYVIDYTLKFEMLQAIEEADVIITGSAPEEIIRQQINKNKIVFRYSERPLKKGMEIFKFVPRLIKWHWMNPMSKPIYMLCASAFTSLDYGKFGLFKNHAYKWGYFPQTKRYENIDSFLNSKNSTEILWCGRFLDWKHPEHAIYVAEKLKDEGYSFSLKFIGTGEMEDSLKSIVEEKGLQQYINFAGSMSPEKVRENMEKAGIYLFTSNRQEGWGAVLNEAMNSGCAVVASHIAGATPYLIKNNENGLVYESENIEILYKKIKYLLDNPVRQKELGAKAYETIANVWNADVASERFLNLASHIMAGEKQPDLYIDGPCSKAEIIHESWYK